MTWRDNSRVSLGVHLQISSTSVAGNQIEKLDSLLFFSLTGEKKESGLEFCL